MIVRTSRLSREKLTPKQWTDANHRAITQHRKMNEYVRFELGLDPVTGQPYKPVTLEELEAQAMKMRDEVNERLEKHRKVR